MHARVFSHLRAVVAVLMVAGAPVGFSQTTPALGRLARPDLGEASPVPTNLVLNPPRPPGPKPLFQPPVTGGLSVNPDSREESRGFYNAIYPASANPPQGSTADVSSC